MLKLLAGMFVSRQVLLLSVRARAEHQREHQSAVELRSAAASGW
jgi:hypothetical protein